LDVTLRKHTMLTLNASSVLMLLSRYSRSMLIAYVQNPARKKTAIDALKFKLERLEDDKELLGDEIKKLGVEQIDDANWDETIHKDEAQGLKFDHEGEIKDIEQTHEDEINELKLESAEEAKETKRVHDDKSKELKL
jgi:hypothetical protein